VLYSTRTLLTNPIPLGYPALLWVDHGDETIESARRAFNDSALILGHLGDKGGRFYQREPGTRGKDSKDAKKDDLPTGSIHSSGSLFDRIPWPFARSYTRGKLADAPLDLTWVVSV
jgi:hypothetical protein